MSLKLSLVIPCYNEAENIPLLLEELEKILKESEEKNIEVILVDNNSRDNTKEVLTNLLPKYNFARTVFQPLAGYGAAIQKGLESAEGEFICWTHADLQTSPKDVLIALKLIQDKEQILDPLKTYVKGQRYGRPLSDRFFTFGMSIYESIILKTKLYDINAQPNLFHRSFLNLMKDPPTDFLLDLYAYYIAKTNNYKIIKFPVYFGTRVHGHSAWNFGFKSRVKLIKRTINFSKKLKKRLESDS